MIIFFCLQLLAFAAFLLFFVSSYDCLFKANDKLGLILTFF